MLADQGIAALKANPALQAGLNTYRGSVTHPGVAEAFGLKNTNLAQALQIRTN
jgi:alanine dehydrogenase